MEKGKEAAILQTLQTSELYPFIRKYYESGQLPVRFFSDGAYLSDGTNREFHIIYILSGRIKIFSFSYNGRRLLLDEVGPGSFSGHISKVRGYNFESNLIACTDVACLEFPDYLFRRLMKNKDFALYFYETTSSRIYHMYQKILALKMFSKEENAAFFFLNTSGEHLRASSLDQLCEEIGISRRSLCYLLKKWREKDIVSSTPQGYTVKNRNALTAVAKNICEFYDFRSVV